MKKVLINRSTQPVITNAVNYNSIAMPNSEDSGEIRSRKKWLRWIPTSDEELQLSENRILGYLKPNHQLKFVDCGEFDQFSTNCCWPSESRRKVMIRTLMVNKTEGGVPLVLLHGLGMGLGFFVPLINSLANKSVKSPIYAIDIPGFGRSTRIKFPKETQAAENMFSDILCGWANSLDLPKFVLAGHSFGGFIALNFALKYPERILHLLPLDSWGLAKKPEVVDELLGIRNRIGINCLSRFSRCVNPLAPFRVAGPFLGFVDKLIDFGDVSKEWLKQLEKDEGVENLCENYHSYLYHCLAGRPCTGERAFRTMMDKMVTYAKNPLAQRIHTLKVPTTIIYSENSFLPRMPQIDSSPFLNSQIIAGTDHESVANCEELAEILCNLLKNHCDINC